MLQQNSTFQRAMAELLNRTSPDRAKLAGQMGSICVALRDGGAACPPEALARLVFSRLCDRNALRPRDAFWRPQQNTLRKLSELMGVPQSRQIFSRADARSGCGETEA